MTQVKLVHKATKTPTQRGDFFYREDGEETYVVIITGWEGSVQAIDLQDGIPWFAHEAETVGDVVEMLMKDHFKKLPVGSVIELGVGV